MHGSNQSSTICFREERGERGKEGEEKGREEKGMGKGIREEGRGKDSGKVREDREGRYGGVNGIDRGKEDKGVERGRKGSSCGPKNAFFYILGLRYPRPSSIDQGQIWCARVYRRSTL